MFLKAQAYRIVNGVDSDAKRTTAVVSKDFSNTKSFVSHDHSWLESFDGRSCISSLYLAELKINICRWTKVKLYVLWAENENNDSDYFHFRYNLHKTSCERSLGGIWILEKYGIGLAYRAQVFGENGHRKRVFSKTLSRVKIFENAQGAYDFFCLLDLLLLFL